MQDIPIAWESTQWARGPGSKWELLTLGNAAETGECWNHMSSAASHIWNNSDNDGGEDDGVTMVVTMGTRMMMMVTGTEELFTTQQALS